MSVAVQPETVRELDPNVLQRRASDPASSVWVSASAGTGKTKVLTDRVLRLLLVGTQAHKILGLTFTKAAASEMALRINETLSAWAVMDAPKLEEKLQALLGRTAEAHEVQTARRLFADVIDTPGRLKIMTIHSFCQSLLARFPLEAQLMPGFRVAEEREASEVLVQAKNFVLHEAGAEKASPLYAALSRLSGVVSEGQFSVLLRAMAGERGQMRDILAQNFGVDGVYTALCGAMDVTPGLDAAEMRLEFCGGNFDHLVDVATVLGRSTVKLDQENAQRLQDWLRADRRDFDDYVRCYLTLKDTPKKKLVTKGILQSDPWVLEAMEAEAARVLTLKEQMRAADVAALTRDLLHLGQAILERYDGMKSRSNVLDYEDLVFKSLDLLKANSAWVQFKLDEGLEHILIDEAQDTNPEQWQILEYLCAEFFAEHSADETGRSVFTVGDEKQSIYSFQRASPEEFARMQGHFAAKIAAARKGWNKVDLNISFRSVRSVLEAVDAVFTKTEHQAFRRGQAGLVEIWPLCESDDMPPSRAWDPPITIEEQQSGAAKLAQAMAVTIKDWLENEEELPSHNRAIRPGDIMVLVRTRGAFVQQLTRALKQQDIPVGGLDRLVLNNEIAVRDLLAAAEFALLPQDDLNLACLLKSPLIGVDEDTLFDLAYNRAGALVAAIDDPGIAAYLKDLRHHAARLSPYEFFAQILQAPCPADQRSGMRAMKARLGIDAVDALDEFLNAALSYERDHVASLQGFLLWQSKGSGDIKREAGENADHVRIMTVHGAKGLQAPIVFLPDTIGMPGQGGAKPDERVLWPLQSDLDLPIWAPRGEYETALYQAGRDVMQGRLEAEYRRLLYVAMTRAEDRLYICGHRGKREPHEDCWYHLMCAGLEAHPDIEHDGEILRLSNPQTKDADREPKAAGATAAVGEIPDWMFRAAPDEPHPPAPLIPSRPAEAEPAALSPLKSGETHRFRRGNLTHMLLQVLPDLDNREAAARQYLDKHAQDLGAEIRDGILRETLTILEHPEFAAIFGAGSRAEVPVSGLLPDGRLISGQIDRLLVTDSQILIVDYKTNRPPPVDPADIPTIYQRQMQAYADVLRVIYPDRMVKCALLWTDGANLMPLDLPS